LPSKKSAHPGDKLDHLPGSCCRTGPAFRRKHYFRRRPDTALFLNQSAQAGTLWVTAYCERPAYWQHNDGKLLADFWGNAVRHEACWIATSDSQPESTETLSSSEEIEVRYIDARSLSSRAVWIETWMPILPHLSANARFVSDRLMRGTQQASSSGSTLGEIERDFQSLTISCWYAPPYSCRCTMAASRPRPCANGHSTLGLFFGVCGHEQVAK